MLRINPGFIGNLTQVQILLYLATIQEMVKKKGSSRSGKGQEISLKVEENFCISEKLGKIEFLSPILERNHHCF